MTEDDYSLDVFQHINEEAKAFGTLPKARLLFGHLCRYRFPHCGNERTTEWKLPILIFYGGSYPEITCEHDGVGYIMSMVEDLELAEKE